MTHDHGQHATDTQNRSRLLAAFVLTSLVFVTQLVGSLITGSIALLVDTAHMLSDVIGLLMALTAARLLLRPATDTHTWGFRRAEVISASVQALVLFAVGLYALIEGIRRFVEPAEVPGDLLLVFGSIGLAANLIALLILAGGRHSNLNMRAAFLEVLSDALGSVAVIVSAILMMTLGWVHADSVAGIAIALFILPRTVMLARSAVGVLLEKTPSEINLDEVRRHMTSKDHVIAVHDLHVSRISSDLPVLTAHVIIEESCFHDGHAPRILRELQECVAQHFPLNIEHSTIQLEPPGHTEPQDSATTP